MWMITNWWAGDRETRARQREPHEVWYEDITNITNKKERRHGCEYRGRCVQTQ